ncbi:MAG TPA: hypothetical protein VLD37_07650 [Candidatus Bilamarchaeum sp.]|nr:hypothetical protein [Candidatus Bilamarchaeum sp.]
MCDYEGVLGSGPVLALQALVALSIAASIIFWAWAFIKGGLRDSLASYALPIALWVLFGSLDILITARGTYGNPYNEGNQLARLIFVQGGYAGPIIASVLWIALWSGIVFVINLRKMPLADFVSLSVFYSLAVGHFSGFTSWFGPLCFLSFYRIAPGIFGLNIAVGIFFALAHLAVKRYVLKGGGAGERQGGHRR